MRRIPSCCCLWRATLSHQIKQIIMNLQLSICCTGRQREKSVYRIRLSAQRLDCMHRRRNQVHARHDSWMLNNRVSGTYFTDDFKILFFSPTCYRACSFMLLLLNSFISLSPTLTSFVLYPFPFICLSPFLICFPLTHLYLLCLSLTHSFYLSFSQQSRDTRTIFGL